jgi:hypothetical protein
MNLASPVAAMLWENWRLTRVEAGQRLALGLVAGGGALLLFGVGQAFWILVTMHAFFYMSIAKLNGGKFMDGYKPGFPLYLFYTRPVSTATYVGVAMAYDAITAAVMYVASAALLSQVFGQPLPLFSIALLIVVYHLAYMCIQWSTESRAVQWIGSVVITLPAFFLLQGHAASPAGFQLTLPQALLLVLGGIASFFLTVAGVTRQRRGDALALVRSRPGAAGYPEWLVNLFRVRCPTTSATRAQIWFELKSSGLPVLLIGSGFAVAIFLLFAIAIPFEYARYFAFVCLILSGPALLLLLGGNAFGIRRRQGRAHVSAFEVTQPFAVPRMAGLKLAVRILCVLAAMVMVGASAWISSSLLDVWGPWLVEGGKDAVPEFQKMRNALGSELAEMTASSLAVMAIVICVAVATVITFLAAFAAVRARYPRQLLVSGWALLFTGLALVLLALAGKNGVVTGAFLRTVFTATGWSVGAGLALAAIYLCWSGFAERSLTAGYACAVALISAAPVASIAAMLQLSGMSFTGGLTEVLWWVLIPLVVGLLAPWSLGRLRHQ